MLQGLHFVYGNQYSFSLKNVDCYNKLFCCWGTTYSHMSLKKFLIAWLIVINIAPLTELFCNCQLTDL